MDKKIINLLNPCHPRLKDRLIRVLHCPPPKSQTLNHIFIHSLYSAICLSALFYRNINFRQQLFGSSVAWIVQITFRAGFITQRTFHFGQTLSVNRIIHSL